MTMSEFNAIARIIVWILMTPIIIMFVLMTVAGVRAEIQDKKKRREEYLRKREEFFRAHLRGYKGDKK